jgi:hypothetical protein
VDVVGIVAGAAVGLALIWAGVVKLLAGTDWTKQAADMGVPREPALAVPYAEIVVGVLLATQLFAPWPAVAALVMLVAYTVLIVVRLLDGSRPPCACFGRRSTRPLGAFHLVRNGLLIALAALAATAA